MSNNPDVFVQSTEEGIERVKKGGYAYLGNYFNSLLINLKLNTLLVFKQSFHIVKVQDRAKIQKTLDHKFRISIY